jgi:hypothetical protein
MIIASMAPMDARQRILLDLVGQKLGGVDDGKHIGLIGLYPVDDPVGLLNDLTDVFGL